MDGLTWMAVGFAWFISIAGAIDLCMAIERRNQTEARRELFRLPAGKESWP